MANYTEISTGGSSYKNLRALIELLAPSGSVLPSAAPYPGRTSLFVLKGATANLDKLYLSDGVGGWTLVGGSGSGGGGIDSLVAGANIVIDSSDPSNPIISAILNTSGKYLISGGAVWSGTGLTYNVSTITYFFNGNDTAAATQVTLAASDPDNGRLDALVVNEAGTISVIEGDPSANPITPAIPDDQLLIQYILVAAGSTEPTVIQENIYLDNTEWATSNYTTSGTQVGTTNFDGTDSPKQGIKCIDSSLDGRTGIHFNKGATFDLSTVSTLSLWVRIPATAGSKMQMKCRFENSSLAVIGNELDLFNYGLQRTVLNTWQLVIVPTAAFGVTSLVQGFRMIYAGGANGTQYEWDVDFITLTDGSTPVTSSPNINFYKDGVKVAAQAGLNFKTGTGTTVTVVNNPATNSVDVTINSTGGGAIIDDTTPATDKVYSSQKVEDLISTIESTPGESAYQVAVDNGFVGTEAEWLASLKGADGAPGAAGANGESAYQVAVDNGFVGTEADWLASLKGADGAQGIQGIQGIQGVPGANGQGVPVGGAINQILKKKSATDFDTVWADPAAGGASDNYAVATGTNTYSVTIAGLVLAEGNSIRIKFTNGNTGASTLNVNGTVYNIFKGASTALPAGAIPAGQIFELYFDGTVLQLGSVQVVPTAANKVITTGSDGSLQASYDLIDINSTTTEAALIAADWTSGHATVTGTPGTKVYGLSSGYVYECSGVNTWFRTQLIDWVDQFLSDVSDGTGIKTSAQMATLNPSAKKGQLARGINGVYMYLANSFGWEFFPAFNASEVGDATFSGDGSTTKFSVLFASALNAIPRGVLITAKSVDAASNFYISNITVNGFDLNFKIAPPIGSSNIIITYKAEK